MPGHGIVLSGAAASALANAKSGQLVEWPTLDRLFAGRVVPVRHVNTWGGEIAITVLGSVQPDVLQVGRLYVIARPMAPTRHKLAKPFPVSRPTPKRLAGYFIRSSAMGGTVVRLHNVAIARIVATEPLSAP